MSTVAVNDVEALVTDNFKLAQFWAAKWTGKIDYDEALSLAMDGLLIAAQTFDPSHGIPFGSWASQRIKWRFSREYDRSLTKKRGGGTAIHFSMDAPLSEDSETTFGDLLEDESSDTLKPLLISDDAKMFVKFLRRLKPREQYIIKARFGIDDEQQTLEEVGETIGLTRERVRQIEVIALEKLNRLVRRAPCVRKRYAVNQQKKRLTNARWYQRNKVRIHAKQKEEYRQYSAIIKARVRAWYRKNRDRALEYARGYRETRREILAAKQLQRYWTRYRDNPIYKATAARRRERNRDKHRAYTCQRSLEMTDGYIRELLCKKTGRPSFDFTAEEIEQQRQKVVERRTRPFCPNCHVQLAKSGTYHGEQRYICWKHCRRTFTVSALERRKTPSQFDLEAVSA